MAMFLVFIRTVVPLWTSLRHSLDGLTLGTITVEISDTACIPDPTLLCCIDLPLPTSATVLWAPVPLTLCTCASFSLHVSTELRTLPTNTSPGSLLYAQSRCVLGAPTRVDIGVSGRLPVVQVRSSLPCLSLILPVGAYRTVLILWLLIRSTCHLKLNRYYLLLIPAH